MFWKIFNRAIFESVQNAALKFIDENFLSNEPCQVKGSSLITHKSCLRETGNIFDVDEKLPPTINNNKKAKSISVSREF